LDRELILPPNVLHTVENCKKFFEHGIFTVGNGFEEWKVGLVEKLVWWIFWNCKKFLIYTICLA